MIKMNYILTPEQIEKIKLEDLHRLGSIRPNIYFQKLLFSINASTLKITPSKTGRFPLEHIKQEEPVSIDGRTFLITLICNPHPKEKKEKPSGLVFDDDLSYLQVKELLLFDVETKELFSLEYSYHYGIWDFDKDDEKYYFRYDRDIFLKNPPKKKIEHFHVFFDKPHFNSSFVTFEETLTFIEDNWDLENNCLELDKIS